MLLAAMWKLFQTPVKIPARRNAQRSKVTLQLESLEGRWVPSTVSVSSVSALQNAVANAVSGETISVSKGTYNLTAPLAFAPSPGHSLSNVHLIAGNGGQGCGGLSGNNQVTLVAPPSINNTNGAIIQIKGATQVEINGFTINGNSETFDSAIQVIGNGSATLHYNTIENTFNNGANQLGYSIRVGDNGDVLGSLTTGTAKIDSNVLLSYNKGGIIVDGNGSNGTITNNQITGKGLLFNVSQNGVQVSNSGAARIQGNVITANNFDPSSAVEALGVEIFNTTKNVVVAQNVLSANESGIEAQASQNAQIYNNDILNGFFDGIDIDVGSSNIDVENNDILNGYGDGIAVENSNCNTIVNNLVCGSTANDGIYLGNSNNNTIAFNELDNNYLNGIWLQGSSNNELAFNVAQGNGVGKSSNNANGMEIDGGSCNDIQFDASVSNVLDGIQLNGTNGTTIEANLIAANGRYGISILNGSSNTTIKFNIIADNGTGAVYIDNTSSATLIQSNLIFGSVTQQAIGSTATTTCVINSFSDADCACVGL